MIILPAGLQVDLHTRLLDEMEEDVEVHNSRLRAATVKVKRTVFESAPAALIVHTYGSIPSTFEHDLHDGRGWGLFEGQGPQAMHLFH